MNRPLRFIAVIAGLTLIAAGGDWALGHAGAQQATAPTPVTAPTRPVVSTAPADPGSWYFPAQFVNQAKDIEAPVAAF